MLLTNAQATSLESAEKVAVVADDVFGAMRAVQSGGASVADGDGVQPSKVLALPLEYKD